MEGKYGKIIAVRAHTPQPLEGAPPPWVSGTPYRQGLLTIAHPAGTTVREFPDEEPLFLLRGQDKLAPMILYLYADVAASHGLDLVAKGVRDQAMLMEEWQRYHPDTIKLPD